jgi:hypothetical protein
VVVEEFAPPVSDDAEDAVSFGPLKKGVPLYDPVFHPYVQHDIA